MKKLRKQLDSFPWLIKVILVIFVDGLFGGLYRLGGDKLFTKIVGVILFVSFLGSVFSFAIGPGSVLGWIVGAIYVICVVVDIITVIFANKIKIFAD